MNLSASSAKPADPTYFLEGIIHDKSEMADFEGPLSLILLLLSKNKIEIRDIKISEILDQYLEQLQQMERMDLEIASEFVQMASHLVYIKTKTLLEGEEKSEELQELVASLEQLRCKTRFEALRRVLPELRAALEQGMLLFPKPPEPERSAAVRPLPKIDPQALLRSVTVLCARSAAEGQTQPLAMVAPRPVAYSVADKSRQLLERLRQHGPAPLRQILAECGSRSELVAAFLAVLELCSMGALLVGDGGEEGPDVQLAAGAAENALESTEEMDYI